MKLPQTSPTGWHQNGLPPPVMDFERPLQHGPRQGAPLGLTSRPVLQTSRAQACCCSRPNQSDDNSDTASPRDLLRLMVRLREFQGSVSFTIGF